MSENYYNILGINEKASKDEIKKAYRNLQMKWHPDRNLGSQDASNMTKKLNEAYEVLGDETKREEYDFSRNNPNPFARMHRNGEMDVPVDDIFSMFFGGPGSPFGHSFPGMMPGNARIHVFNGGPMGFQQAIQKPPPIVKSLNVNMEQVLSGATIPLDIERWVVENGIKAHEQEIIYVSVPQGIDDGEIIILREKGNILNDNQKGDVKVFIKIVNDSQFKRSGLDLILDKSITLKESLCGFSFELKYLNDKSYTLNNNKGNIIPPDYKKVYPGMGLKRGDHKGNLIIHFHVEFPETLSVEQIEKISEIL
jgi:DnaJ-class molecular chaperone